MAHEYRIEKIDSLKRLADMGTSWNRLLASSASGTVFLTWEWLYSWAEIYLGEKRRLFILGVYDNGELIGIAPWYINHIPFGGLTLKRIEFLGTPETGSDYMDVFTKKGNEGEVTRLLYDYLLTEASSLWDGFLLRDVPANSLFLLHLLNNIEEAGKYVEVRQGSFCPLISLPGTVDDFSSMLSSHRRQQFKRHYKVLEKRGELRHNTYMGKEISRPLNDFIRLYSDTRGVMEAQFSLFLERFARRSGSSVRVDFLTSGGRKIAGIMFLNYGDTLSMYLMAIDKEYNPHISIGNVLVGLGIHRAIEDGMSTYDFLKGDEHYKFHWASGGRRSLNVHFSQKKIVPILSDISRLMKYTAKSILR